VRWADLNDLPQLERFYCRNLGHRFARGDACLVLVADGSICAAEWVAVGPAEYTEDSATLRLHLRVPGRCAWLYDGLAGPAPGLWGILMTSLAPALSDRGVDQVFLQVEYGNAMSEASHRSLGFKELGWLFHLAVPGLSLPLYRGLQGHWRSLPGRLRELELLKVPECR
jgi:hypothetical protein